MSMSQSISALNEIWNNLERKFNVSHEEWDDDVRKQFDNDYWRYIDIVMPAYFQSLDELDKVIRQVKQNIK